MNDDWWAGLELKPCPFCGAKLIRQIQSHPYWGIRVWFEHPYPSDCLLIEECEYLPCISDPESAKRWNHRPTNT